MKELIFGKDPKRSLEGKNEEIEVRQEIDGLQARHLQLASCSHMLG